MSPYLRAAALFVFLATARANFVSSSHVVDSEALSVTECDCRTIQTKLNQLESRVSKMVDQLEKRTESVLNDRFTELMQAIQNYQGKDRAEKNLTHAPPMQYTDTDFGPNWVVILQRTDGSVNFNRTWAEYRDGFGTKGRNFWIGLENLHRITNDAPYELAVEMTDFYDTKGYARYDRFEIGSGLDGYPIANLGKHSGSAGDALKDHLSSGFTTYDRDSSGCSAKYGSGGWWFFNGSCYASSLTGQWNTTSWSGVFWRQFSSRENWTTLKSARMMIRSICSSVNSG